MWLINVKSLPARLRFAGEHDEASASSRENPRSTQPEPVDPFPASSPDRRSHPPITLLTRRLSFIETKAETAGTAIQFQITRISNFENFLTDLSGRCRSLHL